LSNKLTSLSSNSALVGCLVEGNVLIPLYPWDSCVTLMSLISNRDLLHNTVMLKSMNVFTHKHYFPLNIINVRSISMMTSSMIPRSFTVSSVYTFVIVRG